MLDEDDVLANSPEFVASMAEADADLAAGRTRSLAEVMAEAEAEDGAPTLASRDEWNASQIDEKACWLDTQPDGTWEVWGYVNSRPVVLFVSGRDQMQALTDLATIKASRGA